MSNTYTKTRELTIGPAGSFLSQYHLLAHQNIDAEIKDISTFLGLLGTVATITDWTPVHTGFLTEPVATAKYAEVLGMAHVWYDTTPSSGTSNSTAFTITNLPLTPKMITRTPIAYLNNDTTASTPGMAQTAANSAVLNLYTSMAQGGWTAANSKGVWFYLCYPI